MEISNVQGFFVRNLQDLAELHVAKIPIDIRCPFERHLQICVTEIFLIVNKNGYTPLCNVMRLLNPLSKETKYPALHKLTFYLL